MTWIFKERVLKGNLRADYDLILVPNQMRTAKALVTDIPKGKIPLAYTKTSQFKFLGDYGSSEDITGGMGASGVAELEKFTEAGGVLVTLGTSSAFPADFGDYAEDRCGYDDVEVLRAGADCGGRDHGSVEPDLLWLFEQDDPGALCERAAAADGRGDG